MLPSDEVSFLKMLSFYWIVCFSAFHFQIDCKAQNCTFRSINGTAATSLTVDCGDSGCDGSHIICPVGDGSSCTVDCSDGTCNAVAIENAAGGPMDSFALICPETHGCINSVVNLDAVSINNITIDCGSGQVQCIVHCFGSCLIVDYLIYVNVVRLHGPILVLAVILDSLSIPMPLVQSP